LAKGGHAHMFQLSQRNLTFRKLRLDFLCQSKTLTLTNRVGLGILNQLFTQKRFNLAQHSFICSFLIYKPLVLQATALNTKTCTLYRCSTMYLIGKTATNEQILMVQKTYSVLTL